MDRDSNPSNWQNWAVFGTRWILLLGIMAVTYIVRTEVGPLEDYTDFIITLIAVGGANLVLLVLIMIPSTAKLIPYAIIGGDWITAGALVYLSVGEPLALIATVGVLAAAGMLRLGWTWGTLQVVGVAIVSVGMILFILEIPRDALTDIYLRPSFTIAALVLGVGLWVYLRDDQTYQASNQVEQVRREKDQQIKAMRENTRSLTQMATALSATLNYEKILSTLLNVGRLNLRDDMSQRVVGMVMLFRSGNEMLHIANSRGLNHLDESRVIRGNKGIVGQALTECKPIIGKSAQNDPELREFVAFGNIQSILCIPLRAGYDNYGVLVYGTDAPNAFNPDNIGTLTAIGTQATVALQNAVLYRNLMDEKERIIEMEENARRALVRDLHDIPTQTISALTMRIRIIQRIVETQKTDTLTEELDAIEDMAQRATEEIRHVLFKLRPLALESQGISAALEQLAEKTQKTYKQAVTMRLANEVDNLLDLNAQGVIFYLIEEAINNARKYAEASMISVTVGPKNGFVIVRIADNGVGFDTEKVNHNYNERGSFGMVNMRERAELLDGSLEIESKPGRGTTITVMVPLPDSGHRPETLHRLQANMPQTKLSQSAMGRVTRQIPR